MTYAETVGGQGEAFATNALAQMGYRIQARNYRCRFGEIDIIASDDETLCFVEVKTRRKGSMVDGFAAVTPAKQRKLIATALHYMQQYPTQLQPRFDVCAITIDKGEFCGYDYLTGAFDADGC